MIYELNNREIKKYLSRFGRTTYGKIMFILCYTIFFLLLFMTIILAILSHFYSIDNCSIYTLTLLFLTLLSFIIGSYNYYKELRIFISKIDD